MAASNPLHPDIASQFEAENYPKNQWGVQNAQLQTMQRNVQPGRAANTPNRPRVKYQNEIAQSYNEPSAAANENFAPTPSPLPREKKSRLKRLKQTVLVNLARVRATPIAAGISAWAIPWYLTIQLPLAVVASVFFGLAYAAQLLVDSSFVAEAAAATVELIGGFTVDMFMFVYLIFSALICFFYFCQIIVGTVLFKIGFIHPWFGRGAAFKIISILLILISSFVPLLNMLPLLGLWVAAVVINPK